MSKLIGLVIETPVKPAEKAIKATAEEAVEVKKEAVKAEKKSTKKK